MVVLIPKYAASRGSTHSSLKLVILIKLLNSTTDLYFKWSIKQFFYFSEENNRIWTEGWSMGYPYSC